MTYQASHGPAFSVSDGRLVGVPSNLWFSYRDGCCDFFVTDCRTEREPAHGRLLGDAQADALLQWLRDGSERIKVIVTSVPMFPDPRRDPEDKWAGYPGQRAELLAAIATEPVPRVVVLSGDVHCSMSAELSQRQAPHAKLISVVSSAFFWPYPHDSARHFDRQGSVNGGAAGEFDLQNVSRVTSGDNFTRVRIDLDQVTVEVFERKGGRLAHRTHAFR